MQTQIIQTTTTTTTTTTTVTTVKTIATAKATTEELSWVIFLDDKDPLGTNFALAN